MVDFRPLLFINALALMLLVTAGFASIQRETGHFPGVAAEANHTPAQTEPAAKIASADKPPEPASPAPAQKPDSVFVDKAQQIPVSPPADTAIVATATDKAPEIFSVDPPDTREPETTTPATAAVTIATIDASKATTSSAPAVAETKPERKDAPEPKPVTAQLTLRSNVENDSVEINGKTYGPTRLDLEFAPGNYDIVINKEGYKSWSQTVRLSAGDDLTLRGKLEAYTRVDYQNGTWTGGVKTGDGTYIDGDGLQYTGHFINGKFEGQGIARYPNGDRYEGNWSAGEWSGEGTLRKAGGASYSGSFANGAFNGQGSLTKADGDILTGHWQDGQLDGHGSLTGDDGKLYVGGFRKGEFHGEGTLTYADGRHYEGGFSNGAYNGEGSEIFADGKKYVGNYMEGEFHGKGTLLNPNGSSIESTFRYGKPYGQAKLTTPEGEVFNARSSEPGVCYREKSYRATQCPPLEGW